MFRNIADFGKPEQIIATSVIPQEIMPSEPKGSWTGESSPVSTLETTNNPQAIAHADKQIHDIIKNIWGTKGGLFGIGSSDGMNVFNSFADKTVDDVMKLSTTGTNKEVQDLLNQAYKQTNIRSAPGEKIMDYLHRATALNIDAFMKNK